MPRLHHRGHGGSEPRLPPLKIATPSPLGELPISPGRWCGVFESHSCGCRTNVGSLSDDAGSFRRVIRWRRPDGSYYAYQRAHAAALSRRRSVVNGPRRRRDRKACSQPRRRPASHHPRHPVRRRLDRCRDCVGACGQAVAHAGRGRDHRQFQGCSRRRLRRCSAGDRLHRQGADRGSAGRAGYVLSHQVSGPFVPDASKRAADRAFPDRPERAAQRLVRVVGRHRRRLGDR